VYTQYLWPISPISPMQCFYGPQFGTIRLVSKLSGQFGTSETLRHWYWTVSTSSRHFFAIAGRTEESFNITHY